MKMEWLIDLAFGANSDGKPDLFDLTGDGRPMALVLIRTETG